MTIDERFMHRAAQIWCEPKHAHKVMDSDFAMSIARGLDEFYRMGVEDSIQIAERHKDHEGHNVAHFAATEICALLEDTNATQ